MESTPQILTAVSNRPLTEFEWQDGSADSSIIVSLSGTYAVTVSDGYCSATDEVELTFFEDWLVGEAFELPKDTTLCVDLFPLSLKPESRFTDEFFLDSDENPQSEFILKNAGIYKISADINGCRIEKNFELKTMTASMIL